MGLFLRSQQKTLARVSAAIARVRDRFAARQVYRPEKHYMRGPGPMSKRASASKKE